jgi:hypothetical protein
VLIETQYGNFYFSVITAKDLADAYDRAETMVSSPWLHFIVPLHELEDFVLNYVKAKKPMKGGGKIRKKK